MTERLVVLLAGTPAGILERGKPGKYPAFTYLPEYIATGGQQLSLTMPLTTKTYETVRTIGAYLAGLLPEPAVVRQRWADAFGLNSPDDHFGLLSHMGLDCPGAVQFCTEEPSDPSEHDVGDLAPVGEAEIAARLRKFTQGGQPSWTTDEEHWSLGGQQDKIALTLLDGQWHEAHGAAATTHIIKPGIHHLMHQAVVEHVTMDTARRMGLDVAATQITMFEDQPALVVTRYDRVIEGNHVIRLHQEDFCQALGRLPENKYESQGGPTLKDLARTVGKLPDADTARAALAQFLAFNVAVGAPDGHAKNVSILLDGRNTRVAPLYDLATGLVYRSQTEQTVALSLGRERYPSRIYLKEWLAAADHLQFAPDSMVAIAIAYLTTVNTTFEDALDEAEAVPGFQHAVQEVRDNLGGTLEKHSARLIEQLMQGRPDTA